MANVLLEDIYKNFQGLVKVIAAVIGAILMVIWLISLIIEAVFIFVDIITFGQLKLSRTFSSNAPERPSSGAPSYQSGGYTGYGRASEIAGLVHRNEYVLPARVTKDFMQGEAVSLGDGNGRENSKVNIINIIDPSLVDQYLQSPKGHRQIVNVIRANNPAVRSALA